MSKVAATGLHREFRLAACPTRVAGVARTMVSHRCYTSIMPTNRRRHALTETAQVQAALDELRRELGGDRFDLAELVVLGAHEKLERLRSSRGEQHRLRQRLAERVRTRQLPVDPDAAEDVRRNGWARG